MKQYGVVLKEKLKADGLTKDEVVKIFDLLTSKEAYPIEIQSKDYELGAMGFIDPDCARLLDYEYEESGFNDFIVKVIEDGIGDLVSREYEYEYDGHKISIYLIRFFEEK